MTGPQRFRKKPVEIEAWLLDADHYDGFIAVAEWCGGRFVNGQGIEIETLEGTHLARFGDYIIKGVQGEFYPCKPEIFRASYEPVGTGLLP